VTELPKMFFAICHFSTGMVYSNHTQRLALFPCLSCPVEALRRADPPSREPHLVSTNVIHKPKIKKKQGKGGGVVLGHIGYYCRRIAKRADTCRRIHIVKFFWL